MPQSVPFRYYRAGFRPWGARGTSGSVGPSYTEIIIHRKSPNLHIKGSLLHVIGTDKLYIHRKVSYVSTPRFYQKRHKIQKNTHKMLTCNDSYLEIKKNKTVDGSTCSKQVCIMHQMADTCIATGHFTPGGRLAPGYLYLWLGARGNCPFCFPYKSGRFWSGEALMKKLVSQGLL